MPEPCGRQRLRSYSTTLIHFAHDSPSRNHSQVNSCANAEPFALQVLGDSMEPEFHSGEVIIVEPVAALTGGLYVVVEDEDGYLLRRLDKVEGRWLLIPLNDRYERVPCSLARVRGRVVAKSNGRGRQTKSYL